MIQVKHVASRLLMPAAMLVIVGGCTHAGSQGAAPTATPSTERLSVAAAPLPADASRVGVGSELAARLETPVADVLRFDQTPLDEVMESLRTQTGVNLFVNWRALEAAGVKRTTPITARLRNVPLAKALNVLLQDAGGSSVRLMYVADDNVITVSSRDDLETLNVVARAYDVRDLIISIPDYPAPRDTPSGVAEDAVAATPTKQQLIEQLVTLLQANIAPETWKVNGGTVGEIREINGTLVVTTAPAHQERVAALLEKLREQRAVQVTIEAHYLWRTPEQLPRDIRTALAADFGKDREAVTFLNDEQTQRLMKQPSARRNPRELARGDDDAEGLAHLTAPRLTLFNGQRAYVVVKSLHSFVGAYEPAADATTEPTPVMSQVAVGVTTDVQATLSSDRKYVTVALETVLSRLLDMKDVAYTLLPGHKDLLVQEPDVREHRVMTSLSIPNRATALVAGLAEADREGGGAGARLYILLKPTVLIHTPMPMAASR
ncbi:MAG TPA: hypothetical protein VGN72_23675 [Tepidisphaeraceae bacterium]|jgi:hypothetical protein|nr:hypothetical protein [Tepidisphaeraceae bacterium]